MERRKSTFPFPIARYRMFLDPALDEAMWERGYVVVPLLTEPDLDQVRAEYGRYRGAFGPDGRARRVR